MRKQSKIIIWPAYFDATRTRTEGRRVSKSLSVPFPKILEIKEAVEKLNLEFELAIETKYPKTPWMKTGLFIIRKSDSKSKLIERVAKQLQKIRSLAMSKKS